MLSDDQLRAALTHERAHLGRGDQLLAACLSIFVDLLPLPADDLVAMYQRSREMAADRKATQHMPVEPLAEALIAFAKHGAAPSAVPALNGARSADVARRIEALLSEEPRQPRMVVLRRFAVTFGLAGALLLGVATPTFAGDHVLPCPMQRQTVTQNVQ
jgi:Zn-dependent protease with chaperone function